ncbi:MAG: hypothetical protein DWG76_00275 [Chloroflexi bacterium]|nr:hypothetical protein [Chloroflexota bacterium]
MDDKITIIEGPPPTFELVDEGWLTGVLEGPSLFNVALTQLRTFNGDELVERCYKAWKRGEIITLEFKSDDGLNKEAPIVAARATETEEGQVLLLWVRLPDEEIELAIDFDDDPDDDGDDYGPLA